MKVYFPKQNLSSFVKCVLFSATASAGLLAPMVQAAPIFWDNNGLATPSSGTWDNVTPNWSPTNTLTNAPITYVSGSFAEFVAGSNSIQNLTITVPAATTNVCAGLTTAPANGGFVTNTLFVSGGTGAAISLGTSGQQGVYCPAGGSIQFNLPLVGAGGGLAVDAGGPITLNATNTYSGGTTITSGGILVIGTTGELNGGTTYSGSLPNAGNIVFSNSTAYVNITGPISGPGNVNFINCAASNGITGPTGQVSLVAPSSNPNTYTGFTTITNGYVLITNGNAFGAPPSALVTNQLTMNVALDGHIYGVRVQSAATVLGTNLGIYLGTNGASDNGVVGGAFNIQGGYNVNVAGPITGPGALSAGCNASFGNGGLVLSNVNNTYTGGTFLANGSLQLGLSGALPAGTPLTIYNPGGVSPTFTMNGFKQTIGPLQTLPTIGTSVGVAIPIIGLTGALTILQTNVSTTYGGTIKYSGGSLTLNVPAGGTPGTLTFTNTNSYTGATYIKAGTLAISGVGSVGPTTLLSLSAGGTLDVSALTATAFATSNTTAISASGTGTTVGVTAAAINGASGGTVSLGAQTISLGFTPSAVTGDTNHPALYIAQGTLVLNGNTINVTNLSGTPLGAGSYVLIQAPAITGAPSTNANVLGAGIAAGDAGSISVQGGAVVLTVTAPVSITSPTITSVSFKNGTLSLTATNGTPNGPYVLLETTDLRIPLSSWTPVLTNTFDASGNVSLTTTNAGTTNTMAEFFSIQNP